MRYILALTPAKETITAYIQAAQLLFSPSSEGYLLSENSSPHITICQFECDDTQQARAIWEDVADLEIDPFPVRFTGVSFLKGSGPHQGFYWAEIGVGRDPNIMKVHHAAMKIIESHGLRCLNDSGDLYRPHLTLARIRLPETIQKWPDGILTNEKVFRLTLAQGDNNGQYLRTIFESK